MTIGDRKYDIAIVGAGPAGSSAAIRLAIAGRKVLLVEQKQFPRNKLCGEFISPECLAHFDELGVMDSIKLSGGVDIERTVFFAQNETSVAVPNEWFKPGTGALGLSRSAMDARLLEHARSVGVEVMEKTYAAGLNFDGHKVSGLELRDPERTPFQIGADLTIDATGRTRALVRHVVSGSDRPRRAGFVAFKSHISGADIAAGDCEIYAYRGGYGGCNRVENGLYNLCFIVTAETAKRFGGDAAEIMRKVVFANKRAARALRDASTDNDWLAVPIEGYGRAKLAPAEGLLTIGDAAAFIDPFTGSGILLALQSASVAAEVITEHARRPVSDHSFSALAAEYDRRYGEAFNSRLRVCSVLRRAAFVPMLSELMIRGLALSPGLTRRLARATRSC